MRVRLPGEVAVANDVGVFADGSVVAAGSAQRDGRTVAALARLLPDGRTPPLATSEPPPPRPACPRPSPRAAASPSA